MNKSKLMRTIVIACMCVCLFFVVSVSSREKDVELKNWRTYLQTDEGQKQLDYLETLVGELKKNNGHVKSLTEEELDHVYLFSIQLVREFPWNTILNRTAEEVKALPKDSPSEVAMHHLYFLALSKELDVAQGVKFADSLILKKTSEALKQFWEGILPVARRDAAFVRMKHDPALQPTTERFVKVVLDKTYMSQSGYAIFGPFILDKEKNAELRQDKKNLAIVMDSLAEDFPLGYDKLNGDEHWRSQPEYFKKKTLQLNIKLAVESLLTLEERYYWFKENVGKPGILENYKEEMEQFITGYAVELETQRRRPTVEKFVKAVLDKTYLSDDVDYRIFGRFLQDKGLVSELQADRPTLAKVMESLTEDFRLGYKNLKGEYRWHGKSEFVKVNQLQSNVMKAAKTLLTRDELYAWFKKNVDNPGIDIGNEKEMKDFIADYDVGLGN